MRATSRNSLVFRASVLSVLALGIQSLLFAQTQTASFPRVAQSDRVPAGANLAPRVALSGHIPRWATAANLQPKSVDLGATKRLSIVLQRPPEVEAAVRRLADDQQDPASPLYHHWLTPQQIGELYGPTPSDVAAVTAWLATQGLHVDSIAPSRMILEVSAPSSAVSAAFRVDFGYYQLGSEARISASSEPTIPAALQPLIRAIQGLADVPITPAGHGAPGLLPSSKPGASMLQPQYTYSATSHYITPGDFATIYDINSIHAAGNTGATIGTAAQHIAVIDRSDVSPTDISLWAANVGLASYKLNTIVAAGTDPDQTANDDQLEATGDVNQTLATANGATTDLVIASNANGGIYAAAAYNVNTLRDPVMNISFYGCEANAGQANTLTWDTLFQTGALEGISIFVCSGDSGAGSCTADFTTPPATTPALSVNYICSSSYATCVGGTLFQDAANLSTYWSSTNSAGLSSALSYIPESAWNEPSYISNGNTYYQVEAGGGGFSKYIAKPSWQTGTGVPADGQRDLPDISFTSARHDGYYTCLAYAGGDCSKGYFEYLFGTSFATPNMAAITALLNTSAGVSQGNLNPLLYRLAGTAPAAFHDVTVATSGVSPCVATTASACNNSLPSQTALTGGLTGYNVTAGYDQATGLGSLDAAAFITAATSQITLTPTAQTLSFTSGATSGNSESITVASQNGYAGTVTFACTLSSGVAAFPPTCSVSPVSVVLAAGGSAPIAVTISSTTAQADLTPPAPPNAGARVAFAGLTLFALLLSLLLPAPARRGLRRIALALLLATGIASITGCGGKSNSPSVTTLRSSAGLYTATITASGTETGTTATTSAKTTFAVSIN